MVRILRTQRELYPAVKLIGKRYTDEDRDESGAFARQWGAWFQNGWFEQLQKSGGLGRISEDYIGAMRITEAGFEYWIGLLMAPEDTAPQGFEAVEIPAGDLGVCYLYGRDGSPDIFGMEAHEACCAAWREAGWAPAPGGWFLERYNCPRYTTPDEKGNVILDYCAYLA